jgi:transcriptional regulator with XRE-family HTH domain
MGADPKYQKLLRRLSQNIKRVRLEKELTQEEMAKFGFNYRHYQKIESGSYSFNLVTLHRVAKALGVDVSEFFRPLP